MISRTLHYLWPLKCGKNAAVLSNSLKDKTTALSEGMLALGRGFSRLPLQPCHRSQVTCSGDLWKLSMTLPGGQGAGVQEWADMLVRAVGKEGRPRMLACRAEDGAVKPSCSAEEERRELGW